MKYHRADIDGLRSLAILPVLLFHAEIPGFSGGFVGVDVFFVISGYLITSIILSEMQAEKFSIAQFYERRVRRIFPALLAVLLFVLLASPFFLLPSEFRALWRETLGALFFVANIVFWRESGYFAADAEAKPLLHMWSLGVEEQFYLLAPLFFYLVLRFAARWKLVLVVSAGLVSLALCILLTPIKPSASFYLVPTRAWELLAGSFLAFLPAASTHFKSLSQRTAGAALGLALLAISVFLLDSGTSFPGYAAILPVAGSALLIFFAEGTQVGRLLSVRPLVFVGLLSYSLYLWHWPLVVFFRDLGWLDLLAGKLAVLALSFIAAWLSWRFVETPTRDRRVLPSAPLLLGIVAASVCIVGVSLVFRSLDGWPSRFPDQTVAYDAARYDVSPARKRCHADGGLPDPAKACVLAGHKASLALWGDSHGVELSQAISERGISVKTLTYSSCPPALGLNSQGDRPLCAKHNEQVLKYLSQASDIGTVVLVAYYSGKADVMRRVSLSAAALHDAGKKVVVIGPTPAMGHGVDAPTYLARGGYRYFMYDGVRKSEFSDYFNRGTQIFFPEDVFCQRQTCDLLPMGKPLLFDGHHPSMHASRVMAGKLAHLLVD